MLSEEELAEVLPTLDRITIHGPWMRAVLSIHLQSPPPGEPLGSPPQPLWPGGPALNGARFTPKGSFRSIYLASDTTTALNEIHGVFQHPGMSQISIPIPPTTLFTVEGEVPDILDLTNDVIRQALKLTAKEWTASWAIQQEEYQKGQGPLPPTQVLGKVAYDSEAICGLKYTSLKNPTGYCIVIFPERISFEALKLFDPTGVFGLKKK